MGEIIYFLTFRASIRPTIDSFTQILNDFQRNWLKIRRKHCEIGENSTRRGVMQARSIETPTRHNAEWRDAEKQIGGDTNWITGKTTIKTENKWGKRKSARGELKKKMEYTYFLRKQVQFLGCPVICGREPEQIRLFYSRASSLWARRAAFVQIFEINTPIDRFATS